MKNLFKKALVFVVITLSVLIIACSAQTTTSLSTTSPSAISPFYEQTISPHSIKWDNFEQSFVIRDNDSNVKGFLYDNEVTNRWELLDEDNNLIEYYEEDWKKDRTIIRNANGSITAYTTYDSKNDLYVTYDPSYNIIQSKEWDASNQWYDIRDKYGSVIARYKYNKLCEYWEFFRLDE